LLLSRDLLTREHDLLFVVLSELYLLSVADTLTEIPGQTTAFAFASNGSRQYLRECTWIPATEAERQAFETTWMALRGERFRELASSADRRELEQLQEHLERAEILNS